MLNCAESMIYEFGEFRLDTDNRRLYRLPAGERVPLQPKAAELLLFLLTNRERLLSKNEILDAVWEGSFVEEANLAQTICVLRKALGEASKDPRYVLTVPGQGYRFISPVKEIHTANQILESSHFAHTHDSEPRHNGSRVPGAETPNRKVGGGQRLLLWLPLVAMIALGFYWYYPVRKPGDFGVIGTLAVLPFEEVGEGQSEKYLGESLAEALSGRLGNLKQIIVRPSRATLKYANSREDLGKIGRELQVEALLVGRLQRVDERIRVNVQLIRTADSTTIWAEQFDERFTDFLEVQDSISRKVVRSLTLNLDDRERKKLDRHGTDNAEAYQDYLRGRFFSNKRINDNLPKAVAHFERAIEKDPNFALAYAGLANCHMIMPEYAATSTLESYPLARKYALKALELDNEIGEAHAILGLIAANQTGYSAETEKQFVRAIELDQSFISAYRWLAINLRAQKRYDEALLQLKKAGEIDPSSVMVMINTAQTLKEKGDYDAAVDELNKAIAYDPDFALTFDELARVLYKKGLYAEALVNSLKAVELSDRLHTLMVTLCEIYIKMDDRGNALAIIRELEERYPVAASYYIAMLYAEYGDREKMYAWLERAVKEKPRDLHELKDEPNFAPFRDEPRFQSFVRRPGA